MRDKVLYNLILLVVSFAELSAQVIKPYLQSPTDTSIWITWKTSSNTESKVIFGEDSTNLSNQATGSCQILSDIGYDNNYYYHAARLAGLETNHFYYYQVITGPLTSAICRFRTQPYRSQSDGVYRFLVFGDHQIKNSDRYELLLKAARDKVIEKYGGRIEDHINLIINDGDQVDEGTLDQYENVHFKQSAVLSGNIPIMTTVGNHETYGSIGLPLFYAHYFYNDLTYKGIESPGGENYYAYQEKNILFIHLSSEHPGTEQTTWVQRLIDTVKTDPSVDWVIGVAHRPIQAEQYVGDISYYIRDQVISVLAQTEKSVLLITGHHHLYARGQVREYPMYHIISGGGSWDQYWGQSTEQDFDDVQKTIDYWTYQIVSFDVVKDVMTVETYAIGSPKLGMTLNNVLIDTFYRKLPGLLPAKPSVTTVPEDTITLPYTFVSSPYSTGSSEPYNSVQFQVSATSNFTQSLIDLIRDYENLYGTTGDPDYKPIDIHKDVDIFQLEIADHKLPNGTYYIRVRHRDRNIAWSEWSSTVKFMVKGSTAGFTSISIPKNQYLPGEDIDITYQFGPGNAKDWIGMYRDGDIPGNTPSSEWAYVGGSSGTLTLQGTQTGKYFIGFFENDGYTELAERLYIYVATIPVLTLSKVGYVPDEIIRIDYSNAPGIPNDWIGIYKSGDTPGLTPSTQWKYTNGAEGSLSFSGLPEGSYFVTYFLDDEYTEACERILFEVTASTTGMPAWQVRDDYLFYPSPSSGKFRIRTTEFFTGNPDLKIVSTTGMIIFNRQLVMASSTESEEIDLTGMPAGNYLMVLNVGGNIRIKKMVIQ